MFTIPNYSQVPHFPTHSIFWPSPPPFLPSPSFFCLVLKGTSRSHLPPGTQGFFWKRGGKIIRTIGGKSLHENISRHSRAVTNMNSQ